MRITSGILGGRTVKVPIKYVRPTQERVREALFSSLAGRVTGARVLDVFAGSGALGLEAWSRGAASVTFVEKQGVVFNTLRANVESLKKNGPDGTVSCIKMDALLFLKKPSAGQYDLIFVDPPYDDDVFEATLNGIAAKSLLAPGGLLVYEMRSKKWLVKAPLEFLAASDQWELVKQKTYGEACLLMIQHRA
ncbi:16S rRNA (guanine(966)-N(2))-methyltransferase RsmD [Verrucomicrobiota bacterium]